MAVVSSCCEAWLLVAERTQSTLGIRLITALKSVVIAPIPFIQLFGLVVEVKSIWSISAGLHTCHKGGDNGSQWRRPKRIPNSYLSSDCELQVVHMKLKPLVIVHQNVTVKLSQALHTPPITLEKVILQEGFL